MPSDGIRTLSSFDAILLGAVGYPGVPDHISLRDLLLRIRHDFDEYINLRPVKLLKGASCPLKGIDPGEIDMLFIRENSEGEYSGQGAWLYKDSPQEVVIQDSVFSRKGTERVIRYVYELAKKENKTLTSISKGNALNFSMVFWDQIFKEVGESYPEVETHSLLVDAAAMFMVKDPKRFQIVVTSNLFGDILTDLGAAIAGGMGLAAGANLNPEKKFPSIFQPRTAEGRKSMTNEVKTTRNLKVIEQSGYRYQATPTVMLKGKWLSEFGFDIGTHVKLQVQGGDQMSLMPASG